jgi:hypothetical protein
MSLKAMLSLLLCALTCLLLPFCRAPLARRRETAQEKAQRPPTLAVAHGPPPPPLPSLLATAPVAFPLGWRDESTPFIFTEKHASLMQLVLGTIGSGKSRYCELQCRFLIDSLRGFCYLDPDGDTAENLFCYAMKKCEEEGTDAICHQIHYIEQSFDAVFGYDPFKAPDFSHLPPELRENAYQAWLSVKVDSFCEIVQSKQGAGDFVGMARLQRVLRTVLYAVGTALDEHGNHIPLSEVFALLDCDHKRHAQIYNCVKDSLLDHIRGEFERWAGCDRRVRLQETESTLNRLRSLLSPLVLAIFTDPIHTIDFRKLIDGRAILLVNLRESDFLSADQQRAIGAMFIHEIWRACRVKEREDRTVAPYYLYIDEAHIYMETCGHELQQILFRGRKYSLSLTIIGQFLGQFRNERVDMIPALLNLCRTFACFLHMSPDDIDILKAYFGYPNLDVTELYQVMDRPDGNEFLKLKEYARNYTCGTNWNAGLSLQRTDTEQHGQTHQHAHAEGDVTGEMHQSGTNEGMAAGLGKNVNRDPSGQETGRGETGQRTLTASANEASGTNRQHSSVDTVSDATQDSQGTAIGAGVKVGAGGNEAQGITESQKTAIVPKTREEWHPTGRLRHAVEDQLHSMGQRICALRDREGMVRLVGEQRTFQIRVGDVPDVFGSAHEMAAHLKAWKKKIYSMHEYYVVPNLSPEAQERRLTDFLARVARSRLNVEEAARRLLEDALGDDAESLLVEAGEDNPLA